MKLKPLEDRVVIKTVKAEEKTASGILLPDTAKEKPQMGEVVAEPRQVGRRRQDARHMYVKKGDKVIYGKYAGTEYKTTDGDEFLILRAARSWPWSSK